eukprot:UN01376
MKELLIRFGDIKSTIDKTTISDKNKHIAVVIKPVPKIFSKKFLRKSLSYDNVIKSTNTITETDIVTKKYNWTYVGTTPVYGCKYHSPEIWPHDYIYRLYHCDMF